MVWWDLEKFRDLEKFWQDFDQKNKYMEASYNIGTDYWTELRITGTTGNKNQTET